MAARVLLLSILFTEVLKPVCCAGIKGVSGGVNGRNGAKQDLSLSLQIEPKGDVFLGKKGITLSCNVNPKQDITWFHNGVEAPPCGINRCNLIRNGALHFYKKKNVEGNSKHKSWETNNGSEILKKDEYRCVVRTNFGGFLRSSPVVVQVAKLARTFKEQPQDVKVYEGEVARLYCLIESVPFPPKITWEHNSKPLLFDHNSKKYTFIPPGVLYISATKLSDAGFYRCIAANDYLNKTTTSKEAELTVITNPNVPPVSSLLSQGSYSHVLTKKSSLRMACAVSGFPASVTAWSFVSRNSINKTRPVSLHNSTSGISVLTLENVGLSNAGSYICSAKNSFNGSMEYQNITVNVLVPPSFLNKPSSQILPNGRTARFECQAQGYPTPRIYWLKDAKNITVNGRRTIYEKDFNKVELAISATVPTDSGVYQCVAVNEVGEIWAAGRLQVNISRNNPDAPTALKCHALSSKKIFISWEPPKYLPTTNITAYTVHYSPVEGGKEEVSPPELGNITSVEVTKLLEPFTNYSFYVRLYNNHGASDQSTAITCSTAPSVPKAAPKISLNVIGSTKLNVTWKPLSRRQAQGIIQEYKLQWRLHQHPSSLVRYVPSNVEQQMLTDLIPGSKYDVRVLARTDEGWPNINEAQFAWTTVTMPSPESDQFTMKNMVNVTLKNINASVILMKWSVNEKSNQNLGPEYHAWQVYSEKPNGEKLESSFLPKNATKYLFTNLEGYTSYTMGLCMMTLNEANICLNKRVELYSSLSEIPDALEATPTSAHSINLTWNIANIYRDSTFEVCYHAVHIMMDTSNCLLINDTTAIIDDLKSYTLYQFKIRVLHDNPNQSSTFSQAIECYTGEDVPGKVENVQWFLGNNSLVRIVWKEPRKINGIVQNYYVVLTTDLSDSDVWKNQTVPGNKTTISLSGIITGRRYFVMVQAATKAGRGKLSDPIIIIVTGASSSKVPSSSDKQKPSPQAKSDQSLGVILGLSISIVCIGFCLCSMYCRRKWEISRSLRDTQQPLKSRRLIRNGNGCCVDRSSTSLSQHVPHNTGNEIELSVLCPPTTNSHVDTKGPQPNGVNESGAREPLLHLWHTNGDSKDLRITENPQYKAKSSSTLSNKQQDQDLNDTQLTTVNCTLRSSTSSLNNNLGGSGIETSSEKMVSKSFPLLEPNG